ncbi:MauE/DoxX family redox-associated membrane protein [Nonomuraea sp. NPDC050404]|uniref:MauE/DoxX family redox-associated membrane protein n=1 Tax=Nonomuraea sp. NPDC050404 TaxID=3155783 RepID=UPI0033D1453B
MIYVVHLCRVVIALVFLAALVSKLRGPAEFVSFMRDLGVFPASAARAAAITIVSAELAVIVLVLTPGAERAGLLLAAALLCGFSLGIAASLKGTQEFAASPKPTRKAAVCRCFGSSGQPLGRHHIARNIVLAVIGATGALVPASGSALTHPAGVVITLFAGALLAFFAIALDTLIALFLPQAVRR